MIIDDVQAREIADLNKIKEWICVVEWVQATAAEGAYSWTMYEILEGSDEQPNLSKMASGIAFWKLGVYYRVWRECRKRGMRFRPNVRGTIPTKENDG